MKVGRLANGAVVLEEVPAPHAGPGEVVVELAACGVCGTDLEKLKGNYQTAGILGHEPVGRIVEVGDGVPTLSVGQRVHVHHHVPCGTCDVCRRGDFTFCPTYSKTNLDPGGFAERFRVSAAHVTRGAVLPLSDRLDWPTGALIEPASCGLTALRRIGFPPGGSLFVIGLGSVGLLFGSVAKAMGAGWVGGAEISDRRRELARSLGFDVALDARDPDSVRAAVQSAVPGGVDVVTVATGAPPALSLARTLVRRGGTVNLFGLPEPGSRLDWDLQQLYLSGVSVRPTYATTEREIADVHALLADGRLRVGGIVTHAKPLAEIDEAFQIARNTSESVKVVVTGPAVVE